MANQEFALSLPPELVDRMEAGEIDEVSEYLATEVRNQVRRAAINDYLATCEAAGHPELTDADLREFRKLVGEESA